jgi:hypothetical protein
MGMPIVHCEAAVGYMQQFLNEQPRSLDESARESADQVIEFIGNSLLVPLEMLALGTNTSLNGFVEAAGVFDTWTLRKAANDWTHWSTIVVPRVRASEQWRSKRNVYSNLVRLMITSSWLHVDQRNALNAAIHFFFDFAAIMGSHL